MATLEQLRAENEALAEEIRTLTRKPRACTIGADKAPKLTAEEKAEEKRKARQFFAATHSPCGGCTKACRFSLCQDDNANKEICKTFNKLHRVTKETPSCIVAKLRVPCMIKTLGETTWYTTPPKSRK